MTLTEALSWRSPFPADEYRQRVNRVREKMSEREIDTLFITSPPNITYLTGYDMIWYNLRSITAVALNTDEDQVVFFDSEGHQVLVEFHAVADDTVFLPWGDDSIPVAAEYLKDKGWLKGVVAIEKWSRAPHGNRIGELEARFSSSGAAVVDGSWIVDEVRLVKSPREIEVVRKAAALADTGMKAAREAIRPGVRETEIEGEILRAMLRDGGGTPAIRVTIRSGPRTAAHHTPATQKTLEQGELVWVNHCGSYHRYHVDLGRIFSIGEPDRRWYDLVHKARGSVDSVVAAVKPGDPMAAVQKAADDYIDSVGLREKVWFVGGYDLGIAIPPDWVGHTFLGGSGFGTANYDPGTVTNYENRFDVTHDQWAGGWGAGFIETFLMTGSGLEVLSGLDREMTVLD